MKTKTLLILLIIFSSLITQAQNQANIWYFGKSSGLDFNTGKPVFINDIPYGSMNANASISDSVGNFLFACNGEKIWNRNGQIMQNGNGLLGGQYSSQGALIVQKPGFSYLYYIFTIGYSNHLLGMYYSVVDMTIDGGLGVVTGEKNIPLTAGWDALEKMTSVRHTNGNDIWIITRKFREDSYAAFLLTSSGINKEPILSNAMDRSTHSVEGTMKISSNKKFLAAAYWEESYASPTTQSIEICRFNAQNGEIELLYLISRYGEGGHYLNEPFAVEFSPDSKLLYATYFNEGDDIMELYQYDMQFIEDSILFKQSEMFIARGPVNGLQLARDGKIYCTGYEYLEYDTISIIHEPWKRGTDCNYEANTIYMEGGKFYHFLPNILLDHLYRFEWEGECAGNPITFQPNFIPEPTSIFWSFGDGNISTEL